MTTQAIGVVKRIERTREAVLSMNQLNPYDQAKITGRPVAWPIDKPAADVAPTPKPARVTTYIPEPPTRQTVMPPRKDRGVTLPRWPVRAIINAVAVAAERRVSALTARNNSHATAHPRQVAMYILALSRRDLTFHQIANLVGLTNHTTAMHAVEVVPFRLADKKSPSHRIYTAAVATLMKRKAKA